MPVLPLASVTTATIRGQKHFDLDLTLCVDCLGSKLRRAWGSPGLVFEPFR